MQRIIRKLVIWCASLALVGIVILLGVAGYFWQWLNKPMSLPEAYHVYHVEKGRSLSFVANDFANIDVIQWPRVWTLYARFAKQTQIKAGEIVLPESASPIELLQALNEGKTLQYAVTLIDGLRFSDFIYVLMEEEKLVKNIEPPIGVQELKTLGIDVEFPEGWFFPDTYQYTSGDSVASILKRSHSKMKNVLEELWEDRDENLPYSSPYEALIMASIIEKETGVPHERGQISGVFVRRLELGMRLQTDPTVIYGMGERYKGNIRRSDLREATPYNTYVIKGLPPTPIANPGKEAIYAALHPEPGNSLYFVARGDGSHYFSATLEEHNNAVNKYQKKRRENYRSSPQK